MSARVQPMKTKTKGKSEKEAREDFLENHFDIPKPKHYRSWKLAQKGKKASAFLKFGLVLVVYLSFFAVYLYFWIQEDPIITQKFLLKHIGLPPIKLCFDNVEFSTSSPPTYTFGTELNNVETLGTEAPLNLVTTQGGSMAGIQCAEIDSKKQTMLRVKYTWTKLADPGKYSYIRMYVGNKLSNYVDAWLGDVYVTVSRTEYPSDDRMEFNFFPDVGKAAQASDPGSDRTRVVMFKGGKIHYEITEEKRSLMTVFSQAGGMVGIFASGFLIFKMGFDLIACDYKRNAHVVGYNKDQNKDEEEEEEEESGQVQELEDVTKELEDS